MYNDEPSGSVLYHASPGKGAYKHLVECERLHLVGAVHRAGNGVGEGFRAGRVGDIARTGFEPVISSVRGRHPGPLDERAFIARKP